MIVGLTPKQHAVLNYVRDYIAEHGYSPSYAEVTAAIGQRSKSNTHRYIQALLDRGHLTSIPGRARTLALNTEARP